MRGPWAGLARLARPLVGRLTLGAGLMAATVAASVALMGTSAWLIASAALRPPIAALQVAIVGVRFFGIARGVARYVERLVSHDATLRLLARLRVHVFRALAPLVPGVWRERTSGDLLSRVMADVDLVDHAYLGIAGPFASAGLVAVLATWILGAVDPGAALITLGGLAAAGVLVPWLAWTAGRRAEAARVRVGADLQACVVDGVQGAADLLAFGAAGRHVARLDALCSEAAGAQRTAGRALALGVSASAALADLTAIAVVAWLAPLTAAGAVSGVQLTVAALVALAAFEGVAPLPAAIQSLARTRAAADRLFLSAPAGEPRAAEAETPDEPAVTPPDEPSRGVLEVRDLTFAYPEAAGPTLSSVSLRLAPGRLVALVGESGAGKSTLVQVLLRFYTAPAGALRLNGRPLEALDDAAVRRAIAWMAQRADVFTGTLAENLRLAAPDADAESLGDALDRAGLRQVVSEWPDGLDTWIGEQGATLSGGERQRLALARVLLTSAPIVLLDEPASQVDPATAHLVVGEARRLADAGRAVLLVSHRLDQLAAADEILVMESGRIVERGTFDALVSRPGGRFRRLLDHERGASDAR